MAEIWYGPPGLRELEVRVFLAQADTLAPRADAVATLDGNDRERIARLRFDRDRVAACASRVLRRVALSSCSAVPPSAWRFETDRHGRPGVAQPDPARSLRFSASNARTLVGCAVALSRDIGLDVETLRKDVPAGIVDRLFSDDEQRSLAALPSDARARRFIEIWTLKEAYSKARGLGLGLPFEHIAFSLEDGRPRLTLDASLADDASAWQVSLWYPTAKHVAALCARRGDDPPLTVDLRPVLN